MSSLAYPQEVGAEAKHTGTVLAEEAIELVTHPADHELTKVRVRSATARTVSHRRAPKPYAQLARFPAQACVALIASCVTAARGALGDASPRKRRRGGAELSAEEQAVRDERVRRRELAA